MKIRNTVLLILLTLSFFTTPLFSQYQLTSPLPIDPAVKTGKLSNGLTYYIRRNAKPEKKVELRLAVNAGSVLENDNQRGLAHFMEHMALMVLPIFPKMNWWISCKRLVLILVLI